MALTKVVDGHTKHLTGLDESILQVNDSLDNKIDRKEWIKKADMKQLQELDQRMYAMFDELPSIYADRLQNQKDHKFFGQSIQSLYAMLTGQEDPMLTAKKISCGSCQKPIYKIDGLRAPHNAWNNPAATTIYKMDQHARS